MGTPQLSTEKMEPRVSEEPSAPHRVAVLRQTDDDAAAAAMSRLELRWVVEFLEVVFVRGALHVHFQRPVLPALRAILPAALVLLASVKAADREHRVIAETTVARVGECHVLVRVIANPVSATGRPREFARLAAEAATRWRAGRCGLFRMLSFAHGMVPAFSQIRTATQMK